MSKAMYEYTTEIQLAEDAKLFPEEKVTFGFDYEPAQSGYQDYDGYWEGEAETIYIKYIRKQDGTTPTEEELPFDVIEDEVQEIISQYGYGEFINIEYQY